MSDDELKAIATRYAEHGLPLPKRIIDELIPEQIKLAAETYREVGRRHHAKADELDQLLQARRRPQ